MKTIVCYGDSNTWGFVPEVERPGVTARARYPWGVRWTSILQEQLGADYRVAAGRAERPHHDVRSSDGGA